MEHKRNTVKLSWACRYWFGKLKSTEGLESGKGVRNKKGFNTSLSSKRNTMLWKMWSERCTLKRTWQQRTWKHWRYSILPTPQLYWKDLLSSIPYPETGKAGARITDWLGLEEIFKVMKSNHQLSATTVTPKPHHPTPDANTTLMVTPTPLSATYFVWPP